MMNRLNNRVTICACASRSLMDKEKLATTAAVLEGVGYEVTIVSDLCKMIMEKAPDLEEIASSVIVACYPRAVRSLFDTLDRKPQQIVDIRNNELRNVWKELSVSCVPDTEVKQREEVFQKLIQSFAIETGADAWYPTLDKERCCDCGKCHDFCLFGVYTMEGGEVKVSQPQNCKNNCPACARMCPTKAVIFPKYEKSPINGGLEEEEQAVAVDPKMAYTQSLRARLEQRKTGISFLKPDKK